MNAMSMQLLLLFGCTANTCGPVSHEELYLALLFALPLVRRLTCQHQVPLKVLHIPLFRPHHRLCSLEN